MASGGWDCDIDPENCCFKCKVLFSDVKSIVQCTLCNCYYHGKCENIDLRGFRMRKATWKCSSCEPVLSGVIPETVNKPNERSRKRSRTDEICLDQNVADEIHTALKFLVNKTKELSEKADLLLDENRNLKHEISELKGVTLATPVPTPYAMKSNLTYTAATKNVNKVLVVKQKQGSSQKDLKQIKEDLRNMVDPSDIGIGVTMGRPTRDGGLILSCENEKSVTSVQSEIQSKLGDNYIVDRPKLLERRIKVVGINECEFNNTEEQIRAKIVKQNDLETNSTLKIRFKSRVFNGRFNIVFEVDSIAYNKLINKQKVNIGWNRCWVHNDYGIIRCFKCCRYGHQVKDCKEKKVCPKCSEEHDCKDCTSTDLKCNNCDLSNKKYGLNIATVHVAWDVNKCETYQRMERIQRNKYLK